MQFKKITTSLQYKRVLGKGKRYSTPSFAAFYSANPSLKNLNIGIIASRKVGGAVLRNLCKRRIRAALRNLPTSNPYHPYEVVIIARSSLAQINFHLFERDLARFFRKITDK